MRYLNPNDLRRIEMALRAAFLTVTLLASPSCSKKVQDLGSTSGGKSAGIGQSVAQVDSVEVKRAADEAKTSGKALDAGTQGAGNQAAGQPAGGSVAVGGGVPAMGVASTNSVPADRAPSQVQQEPARPSCVIATYKRTGAKDLDADELASRKNVIQLKDKDFNGSSICFRVDGIPVKFAAARDKKGGKRGEYVLPPIPNAKSVITARYCFGKAKCAEDCKVPRDEFLDAIGAEDVENDLKDTDGELKAAVSGEIEREMSAMDKKTGAIDDSGALKNWISDGESVACEGSKALTTASK